MFMMGIAWEICSLMLESCWGCLISIHDEMAPSFLESPVTTANLAIGSFYVPIQILRGFLEGSGIPGPKPGPGQIPSKILIFDHF